MFTYTSSNKAALKAEFNYGITAVVTEMYPDLSSVEIHLQQSVAKAMIARLQLQSEILEAIPTMVPEAEYAKSIEDLSEENRKKAWRYRALELRIILIKSIINNTKKIPYLVRDTLERIVSSACNNASEAVTMSQVIHGMKLSSKTWVDRTGTEHTADAWIVDQMRLQLVSELSEMDLINVSISHKTHMVSIPDTISNTIPTEVMNRLLRVANFLNLKTILLDKPEVTHQMVSQSSWWYKTPMLSVDQLEFVNTMHSLKWEFVPNALDLIEEAYREHLDVNVLPKWALSKVSEFKEQIKASHANGGHYVAGKFDSALRWYWQSEIGHNQTSESLRKLVRLAGVNVHVKYDMSNNVVQQYAIGLKDRSLAKYVGLVPEADTLLDLRLQVANAMNKNLEIDVFDKDNIKPLFMVWAYNAGKKRLLDGVYVEKVSFFTGDMVKSLKVLGLRAIVESSGKSIKDDVIYAVFEGILHKLVPTIVELKQLVNKIIKHNPFTEMSWVLPDGAVAQYASVETNDQVLQWVDSTGKTHRHTHHRKELVSNAKAAGVLPRIIHSIDAYFARQLVIRAAKLGIAIAPNHDSFMFDEVHTDTVYDLVRELYIEIMNDNVLFGLITQINVTNVKESGEYTRREPLTVEDLMASNPMKLEA